MIIDKAGIIDKTRLDAQWFLRENGYLLESSRGLAGIDEIKRLMSAETLTIEGKRCFSSADIYSFSVNASVETAA